MDQAEGLRQFVFKHLQDPQSDTSPNSPTTLHFKGVTETPQIIFLGYFIDYLLAQGWRVGVITSQESYWELLKTRSDLVNHPGFSLSSEAQGFQNPLPLVDIVLTYQLASTPVSQSTIYFYDALAADPSALGRVITQDHVNEGLSQVYLFFVNVDSGQTSLKIFRQFTQRLLQQPMLKFLTPHYLGHFSISATKIDSDRKTLIQWLVKRLSDLGACFPAPQAESRLRARRFSNNF